MTEASRGLIAPKEAHVIILDTPDPEQREKVHQIIKDGSAAWWHHIENVWIVLSDKEAGEWRDLIRQGAGMPRIVVLRLAGDPGSRWSYGGHFVGGGDWFRENMTPFRK